MGATPQSKPGSWTPLQEPSSLYPTNITATAPAPYQQFGNIPQIDPTYYNSVSADPFQQQKYLQQYNKMFTAGLQPTFNQQDLNLSQDMASRGITDSSAASYNMGDLYAQQGAQVSAGEAPMVQQAFGQTQQDILANQAATNQARATNASASNQATAANAAYYNQAVTGNEDAYNSYLNTLNTAGTGQQNSLLSAYLNSFGPNTGVTNAFGSAIGGVGSTYGDIYGSALSSEGSSMGGIGQGLGTYFGDSALAGAATQGASFAAPFFGG